jgi:hypothetical protein
MILWTFARCFARCKVDVEDRGLKEVHSEHTQKSFTGLLSTSSHSVPYLQNQPVLGRLVRSRWTRTNVFEPYRLTSGFEVVNIGREDAESDGANEDEDTAELMTNRTVHIQARTRCATVEMQSFHIQGTDLNAMIAIRGYTRV